ncbi:MAG TPA: transporter [Syntrophobacteraceae bacterium]|nr:transporter [Syntrophobacteraceae bacterium]
MLRKILGVLFAVLAVPIFAGISLAAHPLITDDTGTQGKGKFQLETNYEYDHDNADGATVNVHQFQAALTYGVIDTVDVVANFPILFTKARVFGDTFTENGLADIGLDVKWRFFEKDGLSFAVKPGITVPSGDDERGLGAGEVGYHLWLISTFEMEPWEFHFNAGYMRNENNLDERTDLWHVSLATEVQLCKWARAVVNVGAEANPDKASDTPPAFIIGGFIFPVLENLDLDIGVKGGLTEPEVDYALLAGLTLRF